MTLDELPLETSARIENIDWASLASGEAQRLQALGFAPGVALMVQHRGVFGGRDPLAVRLGRMTVAVRRVHAQAIRMAAF